MKRILSFALAAVMVLSLVPVSALAAEFTPASYREISRKTSAIAPGVTQDIVYTKLNGNDEQMVYYLATVDVKNQPDVHISAGYKEQYKNGWGLSMTSDQVKYAMELHGEGGDEPIENYNVVAAINADFYDMSTGEPNGAFAIEGNIVKPANGSFFAMRKDGTPVIGFSKADWDKYNTEDNPIVDAVGGGGTLVRDGQVKQSSSLGNTDLNARTAIGLTEDGKVVMVVTDGKQAPYSAGTNLWHTAEIMKEAGCVNAINLDGGGSTTYLAKQEGADSVSLVSRPCDGPERSTSTGLLVYTTIPDSDAFDHAALTPAHDYVTPGSAVEIDAAGVTYAGTSAELPEGVEWKLADSSLGSVAGGVFTSNGTEGDAVVQIFYEGRSRGETTVHVVKPDSLAFAMSEISVPYGKSSPVNVIAMYGDHEVYFDPGQVELKPSSDTLGRMEGYTFFACPEAEGAPTSGTLTAALKNTDLTATANLTLGKGSEVIYSFESGTTPADLRWEPNGSNGAPYLAVATEAKVVDAVNGRVHNGDHALALCGDWSNTTNSNCTAIQIRLINEDGSNKAIDLTGAVSVGAWVWIPDEYAECRLRFITRATGGSDGAGTNFERPKPDQFEEGGHWTYVCQDMRSYKDARKLEGLFFQFEFFAPNTGLSAGGSELKSALNKLTFYMDDITVDYSTVVPDRMNPVFSAVNLHPNGDSSVAMAGKTVTPCESGSVMFSAQVADDPTVSYYSSAASGIDPASAKAYIDGQPISVTYQNGTMSTQEVTLAAGEHVLTLGIADNEGNYVSVLRRFKVSGNADVPTVKIVAHDPAATKLPLGSVYYVDVVATDITAIDGAELKLDLNNINTWELDHADVDGRFTMTHSVQSLTQGDNIATISLTRKAGIDGSESRTGEVVLASLPIRVWTGSEAWFSWTYTDDKDPKKNEAGPFRSPRDVSVEVDYGKITYAAGVEADTLPVFSGARVQADTEMDVWGAGVSGSTWHRHTPEAVTDGAATCTKPGYSGRTVCSVCNSVVDWGTKTDEPLGHAWMTNSYCFGHMSDPEIYGKAHCEHCGILLDGDYVSNLAGIEIVYTYVKGVLAEGWLGESWYVSGRKQTGFLAIDDVLYNLGEDGVCEGQKPYTGEYEGKHYKDGVLADGWVDDSYYAKGEKYTGIREVDGKYYDLGTDGVCPGQKPYTGFFEQDGSRYYAELGVIQTGKTVTDSEGNETYDGWFQAGEEYCHACKDKGGALGKVTNNDSRDCVSSGYIFYTCETCKEQQMSDALWGEGHKWKSDTERVCTKCGKTAKDISQAELSFKNSPYFLYTGSAIRPAVTVTDGGETLIVESDRRGRDGLVTFSNNTEVGLATVSIEGRGDYDEKTTLVAHFTIVPNNVPAIRVTAQDKTSVTLEWDEAKGASYYAVYRKASDETDWTFVSSPFGTTLKVDGLELGKTYQFRVGSRGKYGDKDHAGQQIVSQAWTYTDDVTLAHNWGEPVVVAATCTQDGSSTRTCANCGEEEVTKLEKLGHDVAQWTVTKQPTISEPGTKTGHCSRCDQDVEEQIPSLKPYTITAEAEPANVGTVSTSVEEAAEATEVTVTATPVEGFELDKITVTYEQDGETKTVPVTDGKFKMPAADVTVCAVFKAIPTYTVTLPSGSMYTVNAANGSKPLVQRGGSYSFTVQVNSGYIKGGSFAVKANGTELEPVKNVYTIADITADQTITVEGVEKVKASYIVTLTDTEGVNMAPAQDSESPVKEGGYFIFSVQIRKGYKAGDSFAIKVNGEKLNATKVTDTVYLGSIFNIKAHQTITVEGVEKVEMNYTVTLPTNSERYSVTAVSTGTQVTEGGEYSLKVELNNGYIKGDSFAVKANGLPLTEQNGVYTITGITANQSVTVEGVKRQTWKVTAPMQAEQTEQYKVLINGKEEAEVEHGGSVSFVVLLNQGYYAKEGYAVKVDNKEQAPDSYGIYTIENIDGDKEITVEGVKKLDITPEVVEKPGVKTEKIETTVSEEEVAALKDVLQETKTDKVDTITKTEEVTKQLAQIVEEVINAIAPPATDPENPGEVNMSDIKVKVGLDIQTTAYSPKKDNSQGSITLDIKPVYMVVKEVDGKEEPVKVTDEGEEKQLAGDLNTTSFHEEMGISVPLPESFFGSAESAGKNVIIRHLGKDGKEIVKDRQMSTAEKDGKNDNWVVNFTAKSFSEYEIQTATDDSIEVTFITAEGTQIEKRVVLSGDVDSELPKVTVKEPETTTSMDTEKNEIVTTTTTYVCEGWKLGDKLYEGDTLTQDLYDALKNANDKTLVLSVKEVKEETGRVKIEEEDELLPELPEVEIPKPEEPGNSGSDTPSTPSRPSSPSTPSTPKPGTAVAVTTETIQGGTSGATTQTTAQPTASAKDGVVTAKVDTTMGSEIVKQAVDKKSGDVIIAPKVTGTAAKADVSIPAAVVKELGSKTGADLTVSTPLAQVTIPNSALTALTKDSTSKQEVAVIVDKSVGDELALTIKSGDKTVTDIPGGVTVSVPAEKADAGTVAMLVREDGTREIIPRSIAVDGNMRIPLDGSAKVVLADNSKEFSDVDSQAWMSDAVKFTSARELFQGTGEGRFSPEITMTRGMLVTVLYRLEQGEADSAISFPDVPSGEWYSEAVSWASEKEIVTGYGNGCFGPTDQVTREQIAAILYRYVAAQDIDRGEQGSLSDFTDGTSTSAWAQESMRWAVGAGLFQGSNGHLRPQEAATRAEVAVLLQRFVEYMAG